MTESSASLFQKIKPLSSIPGDSSACWNLTSELLNIQFILLILKALIDFNVYLDADVRNEDANYGKKFWKVVSKEINEEAGVIVARTLKTDFHVATGMCCSLLKNGKESEDKTFID